MSEKNRDEEGSEFSKLDQELDMVDENLEDCDIEKLQSVSMVMI